MKKKIPLLICLSCLLAGGVVATTLTCLNQIEKSEAISGTFIPSTSLKEYYSVGEIISFPEGHIEYKGQSITPRTSYVILPSGVAQNVNSINFANEGNYQIVYEGLYEGKTITAKLNLLAYKKAYGVNKEGSYARYTDQIITNENVTPGVEGSLLEGDTFTYGNVIDLSKSNLETPVIKYYTHTCSELASHIGVDAYYSVVRLTDYYDPSIYVDISIGHYVANQSTGRLQQYVVAGASYQSLTGCVQSKNTATGTRKNVTIDDVNYVCYFGTNDFGAPLDTKPGKGAIYGVDISNSDNRGYSVFYDNETKQIYVKHDTLHFVTDLDNSSIYDRNLFKGFTTGEVILSLSFNTYAEKSAGFEIESILGTKGEDLNIVDAKDIKAPEIILNNNQNNFNIAINEEFEVFKAESKDLHPSGDVDVKAYYEYGTANQLFVPIINGKFMPRKIGRYSIVYTAQDTFNNETEKIINCNAINTENGTILDFEVDKVTSASAGSFVLLNEPKFRSRNLNPSYKVFSEYEDGTLEEIEDNSFRLKRVGDYKILYQYTDGIVNKEFSYTLVSTPNTTPYIDDLVMPQLLIKDSKISLDDNRAISCSSKELLYIDCDVYAKVDGGSYGASPINQNEYEVTANESVQFKYVYDGKLIEESDPIEVIDVGFKNGLQLLNYYYGDLTASFKPDHGSRLTASSGKENRTVFANSLSLSLFYLDLDIDKMVGTNCSCVKIRLIDYYNPLNMEEISLVYQNGLLKMSINGSEDYTVGETTHTELTYEALKHNLSYVKPNSIGQAEFGNNISNDKCYLTIEFEDVTDDCYLDINTISNQIMNSRQYDAFKPQVYSYPFGGTYDFGSTIYISPMIWNDVLSPSLKKDYSMSLEITDLKGNVSYAVSEDGVTLDGTQDFTRSYNVKCTKYGTYAANYRCQDQSYRLGTSRPNVYTTSIVAEVIDDVAPVIKVDTSVVNVSLNSTVGVRGYSVSDNIDEAKDITVRIYVISSIGQMIDITQKKSFIAEVRGDYNVVYNAIDQAENISSVSYIVRVI